MFLWITSFFVMSCTFYNVTAVMVENDPSEMDEPAGVDFLRSRVADLSESTIESTNWFRQQYDSTADTETKKVETVLLGLEQKVTDLKRAVAQRESEYMSMEDQMNDAISPAHQQQLSDSLLTTRQELVAAGEELLSGAARVRGLHTTILKRNNSSEPMRKRLLVKAQEMDLIVTKQGQKMTSVNKKIGQHLAHRIATVKRTDEKWELERWHSKHCDVDAVIKQHQLQILDRMLTESSLFGVRLTPEKEADLRRQRDEMRESLLETRRAALIELEIKLRSGSKVAESDDDYVLMDLYSRELRCAKANLKEAARKSLAIINREREQLEIGVEEATPETRPILVKELKAVEAKSADASVILATRNVEDLQERIRRSSNDPVLVTELASELEQSKSDVERGRDLQDRLLLYKAVDADVLEAQALNADDDETKQLLSAKASRAKFALIDQLFAAFDNELRALESRNIRIGGGELRSTVKDRMAVDPAGEDIPRILGAVTLLEAEHKKLVEMALRRDTPLEPAVREDLLANLNTISTKRRTALHRLQLVNKEMAAAVHNQVANGSHRVKIVRRIFTKPQNSKLNVPIS